MGTYWFLIQSRYTYKTRKVCVSASSSYSANAEIRKCYPNYNVLQAL